MGIKTYLTDTMNYEQRLELFDMIRLIYTIDSVYIEEYTVTVCYEAWNVFSVVG